MYRRLLIKTETKRYRKTDSEMKRKTDGQRRRNKRNLKT